MGRKRGEKREEARGKRQEGRDKREGEETGPSI
jgi:hypothetical protein